MIIIMMIAERPVEVNDLAFPPISNGDGWARGSRRVQPLLLSTKFFSAPEASQRAMTGVFADREPKPTHESEVSGRQIHIPSNYDSALNMLTILTNPSHGQAFKRYVENGTCGIHVLNR
ncbi:hypothetical protein F2Q68_00012026 [Brassica cretica]|uniref:Uncharacterized protein n=1 Tax=Brassica cretica TaxID=69181 RepID=A0A8S9KRH1_BRACR|nr:hypothetical protein F2Q68_00012026 [Brassica cretica]